MEGVRGVQRCGAGQESDSSNQGNSDGANERQLHPVNFPSKSGFLAVRLPMGGALDAWLDSCLSTNPKTRIGVTANLGYYAMRSCQSK
jgi:hypothetical protein